MASILDRYGIKEVADVTFYEINEDASMGAPVLYLDTLKVSTTENTAENTSARGGKGNAELISWDYGKEINVSLEDALFSAKSMAIMFGSVDVKGKAKIGTEAKIVKTVRKAQVTISGTTGSEKGTVEIGGLTITIPAGAKFYDENGGLVESGKVTSDYAYVTFELAGKDVSVIEISAATFPGTYYVTGDTYARAESNGRDSFFQFVIPKAKVQSEVTLTLEAEGDPSTFSMNLKVLRPADGKMMKLIKYDLTEE